MRKLYYKHCLFVCKVTKLCPLVVCGVKRKVMKRREQALSPATPVIPFAR